MKGDRATAAPPGRAGPVARARRLPGGLPGLGLVLLSYTALALVFLWPFPALWRTHLYAWPGDPLFNLWVVEWVADRAGHGFAGLWDAPIFYPERSALALSDHLLGPGLVTSALAGVVAGPVARFNLLILASFVLLAQGGRWLARLAGCRPAGAWLAGALLSFSALRADQLDHPQLLLVAPLPFLLGAAHRLLATGGWRWSILFALAYAAHLSGGLYPAYMGHLPLAALAVAHLPALARAPRRLGRAALGLLPAAGVAVAFDLAVVQRYRELAERLELQRRAEDVLAWGATVASFLTPGERSLWSLLWGEGWRRPENALFPGFLPALLLLVAAVVAWRRRRPGRAAALLAAAGAALALGGLLLADRLVLGPEGPLALALPAGRRAARMAWRLLAAAALAAAAAWWLVRRRRAPRAPRAHAASLRLGLGLGAAGAVALAFPLVYLALLRTLPGLDGMRVPARFLVVAAPGFAVFAGRGFDRLRALAGHGRWAPAATLLLAATAIAEGRPLAPPWAPLPDLSHLPAAYLRLAKEPGIQALAETPRHDDSTAILRMYAGLAHHHRLVDGYSGFFPASHRELAPYLHGLPGPPLLATLRARGVSHLLVHHDHLLAYGIRAEEIARWRAEGVDSGAYGLVALWSEGDAELFRIVAPNPGPHPLAR